MFLMFFIVVLYCFYKFLFLLEINIVCWVCEENIVNYFFRLWNRVVDYCRMVFMMRFVKNFVFVVVVVVCFLVVSVSV